MKTRTLFVNVNFGMTCIATAEVFADIQKGRAEARGRTAEYVSALDKGDTYKHNLLVGDKTDEEVLVQIVRQGLREFIREDLARDFTGGGLTAKMGDVKVVATPKWAAVVPTQSINCIHCRVLDGAGRPYKCATCRNVDEVK